ncbi:MAG: flagellar motor switch protein FliM [Clostridiales bacterium]|nr:flagellar motor switch protein FliM [Clostridiales bacterium]HBM81531.1 flagellar motor switch protein FliM [Clostridiaceae bacterium]
MSEILSQNEIDELLSALSSGQIVPEAVPETKNKHQVKKYDFKSPKKFSKDHITTLEMVHENYARIISGFLTAQVRTNVQVNVAIVDQVTYEEFIRSISNPTILTIYKMPPLSGSLLLETSPQFVFQILDVLFGGSGQMTYKVRDFTEIEKTVMRTICEKLVENLKLAWEDIMDVQPEIQDIETNPALNQTMAPNEPVAIITLSVKMNGIQTYINLCIPYIAIEKVLDKIVIKYWTGTETLNKNEDRNIMKKRIEDVPLKLTAILGKTQIFIKNFLDLQAGDVITFDNSVKAPIDLYIENNLCYKVIPGTYNKKRAVQIAQIIEKDVEGYE